MDITSEPRDATRENPAKWSTVIVPHGSLLHVPFKEIWEYRELVMSMVHRDFISRYKQTILGSFWYIMQPLLTSLMFTLIFSKIAKIPTGEIPPMLFYLAGTVCWRYFQDCVVNTAGTFTGNAGLFEKVYFPRLVVPISQILVNLIGFAMQMGLFLAFYAYYYWKGAPIEMGWRVIVLPVLLFQMAALGLGVGCLVSAVTTRFRDLQIMLGFFMQLWMYASCVVYPLSMVEDGPYKILYAFNPMVFVIEAFRYAFMGQGTVTLFELGASLITSIIIVIVGVLLFNKVERTCVDIA